MKKKFNPSAALGYKRIKPLYDKAVSDLVEADNRYDALMQLADDRFCTIALQDAKIERQKGKLKAAGHMIGRLMQERVQLQDDVDFVKAQLVADQRQLAVVKEALLTERDAHDRHLKHLGNSSGKIHAQLEELRNVCGLHRAARTRAERSLTSALAEVQALKAAKRKWEIGAGIAVGLVITGVIKLYQMGLI